MRERYTEEKLSLRLHRVATSLGKAGIDFCGCIITPDHVYGVRETEELPAASLNKIAVAWYWDQHAPEGARFDVPALRGPGNLDVQTPDETITPDVPLENLIEDMLARGGNSAAAALLRGHGHEINNYFAKQNLAIRFQEMSPGRFDLGSTTAGASAHLIKLIATSAEDLTAYLQLAASPYIGRRQKNQLAKYGALPPGEGINGHLKHELGTMQGPDGLVWYAFLTQSSSKPKAKIAARLGLRLLGNSLARYTGLE